MNRPGIKALPTGADGQHEEFQRQRTGDYVPDVTAAEIDKHYWFVSFWLYFGFILVSIWFQFGFVVV